MIDTNWPSVSDNDYVQAFYEVCREQGESHNVAEMCAFRQGPALETDTRFMAGENGTYRRVTQLERFPGDPEAKVASRGDIRQVCEKRGWGCKGGVQVDKREEEPFDINAQPYRLADDLVDDQVERIRREYPDAGATPRELADLKDEIRKKHSGVEGEE